MGIITDDNKAIDDILSEYFYHSLFNNPFLIKTGDEVDRTILMRWIEKNIQNKYNATLPFSYIKGMLDQLHDQGLFKYNHILGTVVMKAEASYQADRKRYQTHQNSFTSVPEMEVSFNSAYYCYLIDKVQNYNGKYQDMVVNCPDLFRLMCNIVTDRSADWYTKITISSAMAYFVLPNDIFPDDNDDGYIDDLFIICYVLNEIKNNTSVELISNNWHRSDNIFEIIDKTLSESTKIVGDYQYEILRKVGLYRFLSLQLEEYSGTYQSRLVKAATEKRELYGLLAFLMRELYDMDIKGSTVAKVQRYLEKSGHYDEIERIKEIAEREHKYQILKSEEDKTVSFN